LSLVKELAGNLVVFVALGTARKLSSLRREFGPVFFGELCIAGYCQRLGDSYRSRRLLVVFSQMFQFCNVNLEWLQIVALGSNSTGYDYE
ncbi:hypothetical protein MKW98_030183, partial [Papaver atlanticum]